MGNQMFIYACARSLAAKRKENYCLSNLEGLKYFELSAQDNVNTLKYIFFKIVNKIPGFKYIFEHLQDNRNDYSQKMLQQPSCRTWYYGYFQGEKYLYGNHNDIKKCFKIKERYTRQFNQIYKQINPDNKQLLIVHIRLKDYKTFGPDYLQGPDLTLPFDYYHKLLKQTNLNNYCIVFLSDEIETVKKEFDYVAQAVFSENIAIVDFQLIMQADVMFIAQSSFAWWAAWLNNKTNKKIYVPKYFLGFKVHQEFPVNMIPENWIQIDVPGY
ncbi:MAG: alpha-1,2-fucosyltransferase [Bacteroidia bacterium]|nr:alpha-1,2-fucosyltransferase [Bacteroidia bacterium]